MRITQIISALTVGGAQQLLLNLSQELASGGHHVSVIALKPGAMASEFRREGIPVKELSLNGSVGLVTFLRLTALLRRQAPDIVHTHLGRADNYGRLAARLAGLPVIVSTVHNVDAWKANLLLRRLDGWTSRFAHHLVACSGRVAQYLRELNLVPERKISVIRNGVRLGDWNGEPAPETLARLRAELNLRSEAVVISVIGRLEVQKGHRYLLEALAGLNGQIPNWRLMVVGDGTLRECLAKQAADLKLSTRIAFAGERRDMRLIYAASDLVVLPSLWEGLPLVLMEAMAARRPVIATTAGGIPEIIRHGENGLLVPPKDCPALAAAIKQCCCERETTRAMTEAAHGTVMNECSIKTNALQVLALYERLRKASRPVASDLNSITIPTEHRVGQKARA